MTSVSKIRAVVLCALLLTATVLGRAQGGSTPMVAVTQTTPGVVRLWPQNTPTQLSVSMSASTGMKIAGVQFTLSVPVGSKFAAPQPGASAIAANKQPYCGSVTANGDLVCIVIGNNQTIIADGVLLNIPLTLPGSIPPGSVTVTGSAALSGAADGSAVPTSGSTPLTLAVASPCDLNGDLKVDGADVNASIAQVVGTQACSTGDLFGTGVCNVLDALRVVAASLGGTCKVGP